MLARLMQAFEGVAIAFDAMRAAVIDGVALQVAMPGS